MVKLSGWMCGPWRLVAAALMLVIAAHAANPAAQPLDHSTGSAFDAATSDVTLGCDQRIIVTQNALPDDSPQPPRDVARLASSRQAATDCQPHEFGLGPTGPPPALTDFHPLSPRAPPAA